MNSETELQHTGIPGLPGDFARVVAAVQGLHPDEVRGVKLAEGEKPEDIFLAPAILHSQKIKYLSSLTLGQLVEGKGIYVGEWLPVSKGGNDLKKVFDIYAAPQDLPIPLSYEKAVEAVGELYDWFGYDGAQGVFDDTKIYELIRAGDEKRLENWFIPPMEILAGSAEIYGKTIVDSNNLYALSQKKEWTYTFVSIGEDQYALFPFYWSSTRVGSGVNMRMRGADFSSGDVDDFNPSQNFHVRPIRAELRPE